MAEIVRMPKMSDTMTEGVIAKWHKKIGDTVKSGELMAEIETDKATMDYESFHTQERFLYLGAKEGEEPFRSMLCWRLLVIKEKITLLCLQEPKRQLRSAVRLRPNKSLLWPLLKLQPLIHRVLKQRSPCHAQR